MKNDAENPTQAAAAAPATSGDRVDRVIAEWNRERPDIDVRSMGVITRIWRVGRHLERHRAEVLTDWDADRGTVDILGMLRRSGEPYRLTAGELTKHSLITSGGVSQRLDKLEKAGLVSRHVDTADRRRVEVQLTDAGVELIDSVFRASMVAENELLDEALTAKEREQLRTLLRKFLLFFEPEN